MALRFRAELVPCGFLQFQRKERTIKPWDQTPSIPQADVKPACRLPGNFRRYVHCEGMTDAKKMPLSSFLNRLCGLVAC